MKELVNTEKELQGRIDVAKWYKSEKAGRDTCGEEDYCRFCDKNDEYPCGKACLACEKNKQAVAATEEYETVIRLSRSFVSKLIQSETLQKNYSVVNNALCKYKKVKGRIAFGGETYRHGREKLAVVTVRGKSLYLYLALSPEEFEESKYRFVDESDKASYVATPMKVKITGSRSLKHACELVDILAAKRGLLTNSKYCPTEYAKEYLSDEELVAKGLIKERRVLVRKR